MQALNSVNKDALKAVYKRLLDATENERKTKSGKNVKSKKN